MSDRSPHPYPDPEFGSPWNSHLPPHGVTGLVQVKVANAHDWSAPLQASDVGWSDVVRWRYAQRPVLTTPATSGGPNLEAGEAWGSDKSPSGNPFSEVQVMTRGASDWSAPLAAHAVRWGDVRRWRYARYFKPTTPAPTPLATQVGGGHYKTFKIQPVEYIHANGLDYLQGNVVKYVSRHKQKNGAEDIRKALHYLELILELQYADAK